VLLLKEHHLIHDLYQSREYNRKTFFTPDVKAWLYGEGFLCENWFELVSLYEHYSSRHSAQTATDHWATLTPEERSAEISRRWQSRKAARTREEVSTASANAARSRWAGLPAESRSDQMVPATTAVRDRWAAMTPEERSAELSRRRRLGLERKRALRGLDGELHGALWADDTL
jgi:hypothetical protein